MIEKESEWILPENLRKQEEFEIKAVENGTFNGRGDFGSYYAYLKGVNYDFIKSHAVSDDQSAFGYAKHINSILEKLDLKVEGNVIDIGCAIGTISNAINQLNKYGRTYGLDISNDSIEVAKKQYPSCIFCCQSADNLDNFDNEYFDVIHAKEFYPFTRTNDIQYHLKYLRLFHSKLKPLGFAILQMVTIDKGLCNTYKTLSKELSDIGYLAIKRKTMIPNRVYKLSGSLSYNKFFYPILLLISQMLYWIFRRGQFSYLYILTKK